MKKKIDDLEDNIIEIINYLVKKYEIINPKINDCYNSDDKLTVIIKDKYSQTIFIDYNFNNNYINVQFLGNNYSDYYEIKNSYIDFVKRVYKKSNTNVILEKLYDNIKYKIIEKNGKKYYYENTRNIFKNIINGINYKCYDYNYKNNYLNVRIEIRVPFKNDYNEDYLIKELLNNNDIVNIEELFNFIKNICNIQDYYIVITNTTINKDKNNIEETYDGIIRKRIQNIEEEKIEYIPNMIIKNKILRK